LRDFNNSLVNIEVNVAITSNVTTARNKLQRQPPPLQRLRPKRFEALRFVIELANSSCEQYRGDNRLLIEAHSLLKYFCTRPA